MEKTSITEEEVRLQNWQTVLSLIQERLNPQAFKTWFGGLRCLVLDTKELALEVPDPFFGDWIKGHYHSLIQKAVEKTLGSQPEIHYLPASHASPSLSSELQRKPTLRTLGLNPEYSFENFVVGPGNRFAHAAALAVAEAPAKHYNPLFIYGRVGLGKTHLMQAIAHEIKQRGPQKRILYLSSENFTNQLIAAIQGRSTPQFRSQFRNLDLLLIDDIHFIAGKESTQEEFFHTFNALYDAHKQIVVSSDRPPKEIPGLEERLVSRFVWGLVVDIQPPDLETRVAILRKKQERQPLQVADEILFYIAQGIRSNVRELEGALIRLVAYASLEEEEITLALAERVLGGAFREEGQKVGIEEIQKTVADFFGLRVGDLRAKRWTRTVAQARRIAIYLVREITQSPLVEVGEYFGGRDPATVLRACRQVESQVVTDKRVKDIINSLKSGLGVWSG